MPPARAAAHAHARAAARAGPAGVLETFERLGAHARATHERHEPGSALPRAGRDRVASLTTPGRHIADLPGSGLSNKRIGAGLSASPRTAGARLYRIFLELNIASRAALADQVIRQMAPIDDVVEHDAAIIRGLPGAPGIIGPRSVRATPASL